MSVQYNKYVTCPSRPTSKLKWTERKTTYEMTSKCQPLLQCQVKILNQQLQFVWTTVTNIPDNRSLAQIYLWSHCGKYLQYPEKTHLLELDTTNHLMCQQQGSNPSCISDWPMIYHQTSQPAVNVGCSQTKSPSEVQLQY